MARLIECPNVQTVITNPNAKMIHLPPGDFIVSESIVLDGQYLRGANMQTRLYPEPGVTAITIKSPPSTERRWNTPFNPTTQMFAGCEGIVVAGTREGQRAVITEGPCDNMFMGNMKAVDCDGGGFHFNPVSGFTRESFFSNIACDRCGNNTIPALGFYQQDHVFGDGTNNLMFVGTRIVYSYGTAILIQNNDADESVRELHFEGGLFHMMSADGPARYPLVICEGVGTIENLTFRAKFRGDSSGLVTAIQPGTAENCLWSGTYFDSGMDNAGVTIVR